LRKISITFSLGVSDVPISLTLFDEISQDIKQSNTIATGKEIPTEGMIVIHDKIIKGFRI
tara:strand:+ start:571 stop:750 length:180 start_codon:yes stop_codon:yes gene_type:complete